MAKKVEKKSWANHPHLTHVRRGFIVLHQNTLRDSGALILEHVFSRFTPYARECSPVNPELIAFRGLCSDFDPVPMESREIPQYTIKFDQKATAAGVTTNVQFIRLGRELDVQKKPAEKKGSRRK